MVAGLSLTSFDKVDLSDPLFDSLKAQYAEFSDWFDSKAEKAEPVYVVRDDAGSPLRGFIYLKVEEGPITDVDPPLGDAKRLKVGTMKVVAHGTKLGERIIKKIFDKAFFEGVSEVYVTVFDTHQGLIELFKKYGFQERAQKSTQNGVELVLVRSIKEAVGDRIKDYPLIDTSSSNFWLLAVYPKYHSNLFPDSLLKTEKSDILEDVSHTNTIHKAYVAGVALTRMKPGDVVVVYRTSDHKGPAKYRSVATSICVVEEARARKDFANADAFVEYTAPRSVFSEEELRDRYASGKRLYVVRMMYNIALPKRPIRKHLMDVVGIPEQPRWDLKKINRDQFFEILELGEANEGFIVN